MKYDEFWISLIILSILALKGFGWPLCAKIDRSFFDVPVVPEVASLFKVEREWFRELIKPSRRGLNNAVLTRNKPFIPSKLIPSHRNPAREEWGHG